MFSKKLTLQSSVWLGALAVVASAAGCGGSDGLPPDALAPYRQQTLQWSPCDTTILAEPEAKYRERWAQLGDRLRCTTMRAPMDWAKPERSDVFISVMRVAAADPAQRLGALVFNPGGPGADGLVQTLRLINAFDQSNPQSQQGALQLRLLASYDMVGFSPRGSGASTRLQCATNELQRFVAQSPNAQSDGNLANLAYNDRKIAEACLRGPLTPYINTDAIARDMDLLRELLGEDKLNYVGYSYGTWLGGWYASLFPSKTGRMVLDSAQDMTASHEAALVSMAPARQRLHDDVLLPYAVRHQQYFQLGSSAADINAMLHALSPPVQDVLVRAVDEQVSRSDHADDYLATLGAARGLDAVLRTLPDPADQAAVNAALQQQVFITGHSAYDQAVRTQAQALYQNYRSLFVQPAPRSLQLDDYFAPYWAVSCNDTAASASAAAWNATVRSTALQAPLFFGGFLENPCVYWGGPRVTQPDLAAAQQLDLLMVQSQYDAATPLEGANRFFAQLPNARRVYVPGEYQHALFPYYDTCVDATIARYLLGETPAQRETVCPALPLKQDALASAAHLPPAQPKTAAHAAQPRQGTEPPTYLYPEEAQPLIGRFKDAMGRRRGS